MKIVILQTDIHWTNPAANIRHADEIISRYADGDLFVLPEMFSTGFCTQPKGVAETDGGEALQWMKRKAAERGCAIAGSIAVEEDGKYYNRLYFVQPVGTVQHYDKKHLFNYDGEQTQSKHGTNTVDAPCSRKRFLLHVREN